MKKLYLGNLDEYRDTLGNILTLFKTAMSQHDHRGASPISAGQRPISGWQLDDIDAPTVPGGADTGGCALSHGGDHGS